MAAGLVIPVAVMIAVLLETPKVMVLDSTELGDTGSPVAAAIPSEHEASASKEGVPEMHGHGSGGMFDRIAFAYDSTNKWMSLGLDQTWRTALIQDCMRLQAEDRVLDLATGTADVALLAGAQLRQLNFHGVVTADAVLGVDPSGEMLRRGVAKVEDRGFKGVVRLVKGDAQDLSSVQGVGVDGTLAAATAGIASGSIDKISMSFGIRNVPDRAKAFREMKRVLRGRESNRVCILEFSLPTSEALLSQVARAFITHVVPFIGKIATMGSGGQEYKYLEESILKFPQPLDFAKSLAQEGLPVQSITSFAFGAVHLYSATPVQR